MMFLRGRPSMKSILTMMLCAGFAASSHAQTPTQIDDAAAVACRKITAPASDPANAVKAQEAAFQKCMAMSIPSGQRREDALFREKAGSCSQDADAMQKRDGLPVAERDRIYANCMAPRYIVQ